MRRKTFAISICLLVGFGLPLSAAPGDTLLPDLIVNPNDLYDNEIVRADVFGGLYLRISNGVANVGDGPLIIRTIDGSETDSTQAVEQLMQVEGGPFATNEAGTFIFHPTHGHIHFEGWALFQLREVLADDGVGDPIAIGNKISFCIVDESVFDNTLPNFDPAGPFILCGVPPGETVVQGLSVGWIDTYDKSLPDQFIDITTVPDGEYWLESIADPDNRIIERDETNNVARIKITLGSGGDSYEPNDAIVVVNDRESGVPNSPNIGPAAPELTITNLSLHVSGDRDYFKVYFPGEGAMGDYVRLTFPVGPDVPVLQLLDSAYQLVGQATTGFGERVISLDGLAAGWHYIKVIGQSGSLLEDYTLEVNPPANSPPTLTLTTPVQADTILHGFDTYPVEWNYSDPEGNSAWVTFYVNDQPVLDGTEFMLPQTRYTPAEFGQATINSAYLDSTTYYVYGEITDGGSVSGSWATGTLTLIPPPCCFALTGNVDCDPSGETGLADLSTLIDHLFITFAPLCCAGEADMVISNGDEVGLQELSALINHLFISFEPLPSCR